MTYATITPIGSTINAIDMRGKAVKPFIPYSVRGPQFVEMKDGTILYFFDAKYNTTLDEEPSAKVLLRSHDGGHLRLPVQPFNHPSPFPLTSSL